MTTRALFVALALTGCANPHQQVAQVCDAHGWQSGQCAYAQGWGARQQAHANALIRQGARDLSRTGHGW